MFDVLGLNCAPGEPPWTHFTGGARGCRDAGHGPAAAGHVGGQLGGDLVEGAPAARGRPTWRVHSAFWQAPSLDDAAVQRLQSFDREGACAAYGWIAAKSIATRLIRLGGPRWRHPAACRSSSPACCATPCTARWAPAMGPGAAGNRRVHRPFRGLARHGLGHLPRAQRHGGSRADHHRPRGRPRGRGPGHDRCGLAVAIPAVLAYNVFGRFIGRIEADLEGFARDLRELLVDTAPPQGRVGMTERVET
jgi:biopolymer transport protein ExbB